MATSRVLRGVLGNFLGTYTSRYCDYDGYWLFGLLVPVLGDLHIDLLAPVAGVAGSSCAFAVATAVAAFEDQALKAGLARSQVQKAWLTIRQLPGSLGCNVNGQLCNGYNILFSVGAVADTGRQYAHEKIIIVAPHNAAIERRSTRAAEQ